MPLTAIPFIDSLLAPFRRKRDAAIQFYSQILNNHFPWYKRLDTISAQKFAARVYHFRRSKNFHFLEMESNEEIEVLVSAAAVQLTFGLPEYNYGFFEDIYIIKGAYTYGLSTTPWAGHVNRQGIYVAWDHVLKGYVSETDGYNVGLHEMAHAFEYELAFGGYAHDHALKYNFGMVNGAMKQEVIEQPNHPAALYSLQGTTNIHECWAESVEFFFEKPTRLHEFYPGLYQAISQLLNQDPVYWIQPEKSAETVH
ncbi:zinc-dependent peptidase [Pseudobacter ginsenosidimutans]|jgi:Mlc titration factor MtfA (ptsG expression regulator)|uniref:Zinc-dependent peptidase n=4 Tax=Pseudobacter ginsenosidimutans TaxID=661488 RepID=A0A4Q7MLN9_9BACT|nr:zinc-dependent peptidase [Pseudobacter ginsenosidimutans]RZS69236.1 hypothetical protein EV199_5072 [Pseudobacter ginsenosidimutans]